MFRSVNAAKAAMITEGPKDKRFFSKVINPERCVIVVAGCRAHVLDALTELRKTGHSGIIAVIDADTDHLEGKTLADPDVVVTETRDLEGIILKSAVIGQVLVEYDLAGDALGKNAEKTLVEAAAQIGYARWVSQKSAWLLTFPTENFSAFVNLKTLVCNVKAMCLHLASKNKHRGVTAGELEKKVVESKQKQIDCYKVARGHDITGILAWALRGKTGKTKKDGAFIDNSLVETHLRLAYNPEEFQRTGIYSALRAWEARNAPFGTLP